MTYKYNILSSITWFAETQLVLSIHLAAVAKQLKKSVQAEKAMKSYFL